MNQTIHAILHHLFKNYRNITPLELKDNDTKMRSNWDPNSPFNCLIKQIEDGQDYTEDGQPYTTKQLLHIAYSLVFKTGLYFEECKQWNNCPATEKTWANFKCLVCNQLHTTKQAGFHSNYANHTPTNETQPPAVYCEALIILASSASANRELLTTLANSMATSTNTLTNSTNPTQTHATNLMTLTLQLIPPPSLPSPHQQLISNNNYMNSRKRIPISTTTTTAAHANTATMATIAGAMAIALGTTAPAQLAKTKPQVTKTGPPMPTCWAAVKPTNWKTCDRPGGVFSW